MRWSAAALLLVACSEPVHIGSEILWQAGHEGADLGEWEQGSSGGVLDGTVDVVDGHARSGRFAARLENPADSLEGGSCLERRFGDLSRAFYGAWYFLPEAPTTRAAWTLLRFRSLVSDGDPGAGGGGGDAALADGGAGGDGSGAGEWRSVLDLGMRSLPDGALALYVFDHDRKRLRLPQALPPAILPEGRWFHLEVFYESSPEAEGRFVVWLDGRAVYGVSERPLGDGANVTFAVCNVGQSEEDGPVEVFVDDVVVSRIRTTPKGKLGP